MKRSILLILSALTVLLIVGCGGGGGGGGGLGDNSPYVGDWNCSTGYYLYILSSGQIVAGNSSTGVYAYGNMGNDGNWRISGHGQSVWGHVATDPHNAGFVAWKDTGNNTLYMVVDGQSGTPTAPTPTADGKAVVRLDAYFDHSGDPRLH